MNVGRGQLIRGDTAPKDAPDDNEIERYAAAFRLALALARDDRAEAARIDALVAALEADESLYKTVSAMPQELYPHRHSGRRFRWKDPDVLAVAPLLAKPPKKKTKNQVLFNGFMMNASIS